MMRDTIGTLLYGLHVMVHPFEGFWELKHRRKKALPAACMILALALLTVFARLQLTGFLFQPPDPQSSNVLMEMLALAAPLTLWVVINWSITTLFDGKGRMSDVFIFSCFSLLPLVVIGLPSVIVSHVLTLDEAVFYYVAESVAGLWLVFLILAGSVSVHDYTMFKSIVTALCTLAGIAATVFLGMVVYSAVSQLINFFAALAAELRYW